MCPAPVSIGVGPSAEVFVRAPIAFLGTPVPTSVSLTFGWAWAGTPSSDLVFALRVSDPWASIYTGTNIDTTSIIPNSGTVTVPYREGEYQWTVGVERRNPDGTYTVICSPPAPRTVRVTYRTPP